MRLRPLILGLLLISAGVSALLIHAARTGGDSKFIPTGAPDPIMADFDPINRQLYILHDAMDNADVKVTKLSTADFSVIDVFPIGRFVTEIAYHQPSNKLYYLENIVGQNGKLWEYDCSTKQELRSVEIPPFPKSLIIDSSGQYIYVACGEYPKAVFDMDIDPESDPEFWDERRGSIVKVDKQTFTIASTQTCYSGPLFLGIDSSGSSLLVTNSVKNKTLERIATTYKGLPASKVTGIEDLFYHIERFSTSDLSLIEEFQAGSCVMGSPANNLAIIGGSHFGSQPERPTLLVNLATGVRQTIDMSAYDYRSMSNSAVSSSLNKAFIMRVHETEPKGEMIVVNLTDLSSYQYHVADYGFNQIIVDEVGDQLILMNNQGLGLVSVSPIP